MTLIAEETGSSLDNLVTAVTQAGFHYLEPDVLQRCVQEAATELQLEELWQWRQAQLAGAAPLEITDLHAVESVMSTSDSRALWPRRHSEIVERADGPRADAVGVARRYWREGLTIHTHPIDPSSITVRYWTANCWQTGGALPATGDDLVLMPARMEAILLALARERCHIHNGDLEQAQLARGWAEGQIAKKRDQELVPGWDEPDVIRVHEAW